MTTDITLPIKDSQQPSVITTCTWPVWVPEENKYVPFQVAAKLPPPPRHRSRQDD